METELRKSIHTLNAFPAKPVFKNHLAIKQGQNSIHSAVREQRGPSAPLGWVSQETRVVPAQAASSPTGHCHTGHELTGKARYWQQGPSATSDMAKWWAGSRESSQEQRETAPETGLATRLQREYKVHPGARTKDEEWMQPTTHIQGVHPGDKIPTALCCTPTATGPEAPALKPWQTWPRSKTQN